MKRSQGCGESYGYTANQWFLCLTVCLRMLVGFSFLCAEGLSNRTNLFYFFVIIFLIKYIFILSSILFILFQTLTKHN